MIAPPRPKPVFDEKKKEPRPSALPDFRRLLSAASLAVALPFALALLTGRIWLALSLLAGMAFSLIVCGVLYIFVEVGMKTLAGVNAGNGAGQRPNLLPLLVLLPGKFLILGAVGYAIFSVHAISLPAVLVGFVLAQTAIVVTASRKPRTGK